MSDKIKQLQGYVADTYPDFVFSDFPDFAIFLDAYYEWLEKENTEVATSARDVFKSLPNPGALINNAPEYRDIDLTVAQFMQYFKREVLPFAPELSRVDDAFLVKKMREVFLAKGSSKSFDLLFRMLYDQNIEIIETRDFILELSNGKFSNIVICYVAITDRVSDLDKLNLSTANLYDSENGEIVGTILNAVTVGVFDSDNKRLIQLQLAYESKLPIGYNAVIRNLDTTEYFINVKVVPSLKSIKAINSAGNLETDVVIIKSKASGRSTTATITTSSGPVTHLFVRNRGVNYRVGDEIVFNVANLAEGDGASAKITEVDSKGSVLSIEGIPCRTGENNNSVYSNNFEEALIRLPTGGKYKVFPTLSIRDNDNNVYGQPYNNIAEGYGLQVLAYSEEIGNITSVNTTAAGAYEDSDDVEIIAPTYVRLFNAGTLTTGNYVVVQRWIPDSEAFLRDSETVIISIKHNNPVAGTTLRLPYGFDSETFAWLSNEYVVDSDGGFTCFENAWDSDNNTIQQNELFVVSRDSDEILLKMEGSLTWALDDFHFSAIDTFQTIDSDFSISYTVDTGNLRPAKTGTAGYWETTKYRAKIYRTSGSGQYFLVPLGNYDFPSTPELNELSEPRDTILRLSYIDPTTDRPISFNNLALQDIIAQWSTPQFKFELAGVWSTDKRYLDETGFLNSPSGGVIHDGYVYSYFTYIIQTILPVSRWRKVVRDTLHPAGMLMLAEIKLQQNKKVTPEFNAASNIGFLKQTSIFDSAQDYASTYRESLPDISQVFVDNAYYTANAGNVYDTTNVNGIILTADHQATTTGTELNTYNGNSWWDYEPLGMVRREHIDSDAVDETIVNWYEDFEKRRVTTQNQTDTTNSTKVLTEYVFHQLYDGTRDSMYKTNARFNKVDPTGIVRTVVTANYYDVWDSDLDPYAYARFSDSDSEVIRGFDYKLLDSENMIYKAGVTKRQLDLRFEYERDLQLAMREDDSLTFYNDSEDVTYSNYDAFEMKWNTYNSKRITIEPNGSQWQIPGYSSWVQNRGSHDRGNPRGASWTTNAQYSNTKTPYYKGAWFISGDSDNALWTDTYLPPINTKTQFLISFDDYPINNFETFRNTEEIMRGRKKH